MVKTMPPFKRNNLHFTSCLYKQKMSLNIINCTKKRRTKMWNKLVESIKKSRRLIAHLIDHILFGSEVALPNASPLKSGAVETKLGITIINVAEAMEWGTNVENDYPEDLSQ